MRYMGYDLIDFIAPFRHIFRYLSSYIKKRGMNKIISEPLNKKAVKATKNILDGILPFTEKPANENEKKEYDRDQQRAYDLFSHFTANIIKEEATFVR